MKLHGNSGYGRTLTNKEKHLDIRYCNEANIGRVVNDSHFRKLDIIDEDLYEVSKTKKSISMNLPIQIGFFVYQYAKLRMLEFYYDFVFEIYQILFAFYSQQKLAKHHLFATVSYLKAYRMIWSEMKCTYRTTVVKWYRSPQVIRYIHFQCLKLFRTDRNIYFQTAITR